MRATEASATALVGLALLSLAFAGTASVSYTSSSSSATGFVSTSDISLLNGTDTTPWTQFNASDPADGFAAVSIPVNTTSDLLLLSGFSFPDIEPSANITGVTVTVTTYSTVNGDASVSDLGLALFLDANTSATTELPPGAPLLDNALTAFETSVNSWSLGAPGSAETYGLSTSFGLTANSDLAALASPVVALAASCDSTPTSQPAANCSLYVTSVTVELTVNHFWSFDEPSNTTLIVDAPANATSVVLTGSGLSNAAFCTVTVPVFGTRKGPVSTANGTHITCQLPFLEPIPGDAIDDDGFFSGDLNLEVEFAAGHSSDDANFGFHYVSPGRCPSYCGKCLREIRVDSSFGSVVTLAYEADDELDWAPRGAPVPSDVVCHSECPRSFTTGNFLFRLNDTLDVNTFYTGGCHSDTMASQRHRTLLEDAAVLELDGNFTIGRGGSLQMINGSQLAFMGSDGSFVVGYDDEDADSNSPVDLILDAGATVTGLQRIELYSLSSGGAAAAVSASIDTSIPLSGVDLDISGINTGILFNGNGPAGTIVWDNLHLVQEGTGSGSETFTLASGDAWDSRPFNLTGGTTLSFSDGVIVDLRHGVQLLSPDSSASLSMSNGCELNVIADGSSSSDGVFDVPVSFQGGANLFFGPNTQTELRQPWTFAADGASYILSLQGDMTFSDALEVSGVEIDVVCQDPLNAPNVTFAGDDGSGISMVGCFVETDVLTFDAEMEVIVSSQTSVMTTTTTEFKDNAAMLFFLSPSSYRTSVFSNDGDLVFAADEPPTVAVNESMIETTVECENVTIVEPSGMNCTNVTVLPANVTECVRTELNCTETNSTVWSLVDYPTQDRNGTVIRVVLSNIAAWPADVTEDTLHITLVTAPSISGSIDAQLTVVSSPAVCDMRVAEAADTPGGWGVTLERCPEPPSTTDEDADADADEDDEKETDETTGGGKTADEGEADNPFAQVVDRLGGPLVVYSVVGVVATGVVGVLIYVSTMEPEDPTITLEDGRRVPKPKRLVTKHVDKDEMQAVIPEGFDASGIVPDSAT